MLFAVSCCKKGFVKINGVPALMSSYTLSATSSRYRPAQDNATYLYSNLVMLPTY